MDVSGTVVGVEKWTAPQMKAVLDGDGRIVVKVPDLNDPCGTRKLAREVVAAFDNGDGTWDMHFGEPDFYPWILRTEHDWPYTHTDEALATKSDSGPCSGCVMVARMREEEAAAETARRVREQEERRAAVAAAREEGRSAGELHARLLVAYSPTVERWADARVPHTVPSHYGEHREDYLSGWAEGVDVVLEEEDVTLPEEEDYDDHVW